MWRFLLAAYPVSIPLSFLLKESWFGRKYKCAFLGHSSPQLDVATDAGLVIEM